MFTKFIKNLFKETTNVATTGSVTLNTTGNYNPKYGKQHIIISGKGGTGSYTAGTENYITVGGNVEYNTVTGFDVYNPSNSVAATSSGVDTGTNVENAGDWYGKNVNETTSPAPRNYVYSNTPAVVNTGTPNSAGYNQWYTDIIYEYYVAIPFDPGNTANYNASTQNETTYIPATPGTIGYRTSVTDAYSLIYGSGAPNTANTTTWYRYWLAYDITVTYSALYTASVPAGYSSPVHSNAYYQVFANSMPKTTFLPADDVAGGATNNPVLGVIPVQPVAGTFNTETIKNYNTPTTYSGFHRVHDVVHSYHTGANAFTQLGTYESTNNPTYPSYTNSPTSQYAGTNNPSTNTGQSTNVFGVSIPGGYGGAATAILPTIAPYLSVNKLTSVSITVPSGGYVTITYKI